jgi:omega-6 fatty acid desaturase (delta-12 desaturase)
MSLIHAAASKASGNVPRPGSLLHLRARDRAGWAATLGVAALFATGLWLALQDAWWIWAAGQLVLALSFLQWFVLLHEAGHNTLFRSRRLNRGVGQVAGLFALIPFQTWQRIHARHHKYTGWQDLDATTALLVPRPIKTWERRAMNLAWATCLPLFSILYRIQNFWNLPRVGRYLRREQDNRSARRNTWLLILLYVALAITVGPGSLFRCLGVGLLLSLMAQDVILLSQHTHMPTNLSAGVPVRAFTPMQQEQFTRSLRLPEWLSRLLLRFDLHELHHMYVQVPGYDLHRIPYIARNQVNWLDWARGAKQLAGTAFLFGRRDQTGFRR